MINEGIPFVRANNMKNGIVVWENMKFISVSKHEKLKKGHLKAGDVLFTNRGEIGKVAILGEDFKEANLNSQIAWFRTHDMLETRFLFYYLISPTLKSHFNNEKSGAALQQLTIRQINAIEIPIPSKDEQQKIIDNLDTTFELIDRAKANIEKNIQNAKELFQSKLNQVFSENGEGWQEKRLEEVFRLRSGAGLTSKEMIPDGKYPVYGGNRIAGYFNEYNFENGVIIGRVGALCGNVRFINQKIWITDNAFKLTDFKFDLDFKYLTYLLNWKNLRSYARQAAQPVISNSSLKDVLLNFPSSLDKQKEIVSKLDQLSAQTELLQQKYQQKLANLEELKKSILEKAFKGEL